MIWGLGFALRFQDFGPRVDGSPSKVAEIVSEWSGDSVVGVDGVVQTVPTHIPTPTPTLAPTPTPAPSPKPNLSRAGVAEVVANRSGDSVVGGDRVVQTEHGSGAQVDDVEGIREGLVLSRPA